MSSVDDVTLTLRFQVRVKSKLCFKTNIIFKSDVWFLKATKWTRVRNENSIQYELFNPKPTCISRVFQYLSLSYYNEIQRFVSLKKWLTLFLNVCQNLIFKKCIIDHKDMKMMTVQITVVSFSKICWTWLTASFKRHFNMKRTDNFSLLLQSIAIHIYLLGCDLGNRNLNSTMDISPFSSLCCRQFTS